MEHALRVDGVDSRVKMALEAFDHEKAERNHQASKLERNLTDLHTSSKERWDTHHGTINQRLDALEGKLEEDLAKERRTREAGILEIDRALGIETKSRKDHAEQVQDLHGKLSAELKGSKDHWDTPHGTINNRLDALEHNLEVDLAKERRSREAAIQEIDRALGIETKSRKDHAGQVQDLHGKLSAELKSSKDHWDTHHGSINQRLDALEHNLEEDLAKERRSREAAIQEIDKALGIE